MATQLVPFSSGQLPAFLANRKGSNTDLTTHVGNGGFDVLSIKGKIFAKVHDQERTIIEKPDADGDMAPARAIEIVIIKANPNLSKVWYAKEFEEGANAGPDCASDNGKVPNADVETPQSKSCATCKHNVWGSGRGGKGKACTDSRRLAIAPAGQLNEPMLLRVPPASLKPLADYAKLLDNRGCDYDAVVTKLKFDPESATPLLVFNPVGFLTDEMYATVQEQKGTDLIRQITGELASPAREKAEPAAEEAPTPKVKAKPAPAPVADDEDEDEVPAPKPKAKAKPAPVVEDDELDAAVAPAKKVEAEAPAKPKKPAVVADDLDDLDALLGELDD